MSCEAVSSREGALARATVKESEVDPNWGWPLRYV
jgi:hypothetical protein